MLRVDRLDPDRAMVLLIDIQEKLTPFIRGQERVVECSRELLMGAKVFGLPVLATEQYPKGIGATIEPIQSLLAAAEADIIEKMAFSACGAEAVMEALNAIDRPQIIVLGIEAHVCVQQTVLDLLAMDYEVFVPADAVGSRGRVDEERALLRMQHAGAAVTSVESILFELCERCDTERFKGLLGVIKSFPTPPPE